MRKFVRSLALVAGLAAPLSIASAQGGNFGVGSKILSVGLLGGGNNFGIGGGVAFEVGAKELAPDFTLGVGGFIGFTQKTYDCSIGCTYTFRAIPIAAIGNVHYKLKDQPKLDLYGGLSLGFTNYSSSSSYTGFNSDNFGASSGLGFGLQVGARYNLTDKVAGMLQLGGGSNTALYFLGLTFKM
ncbi:MAG: outer membrane beta-barrel protein [Gemmatimonadaceae bacterium]